MPFDKENFQDGREQGWRDKAAEIERLRADKKKLLEIIRERQCEEMECSIADCLDKELCCCALEDINEQ